MSTSTLVDVLWIDGQFLGRSSILILLADICLWPGIMYFASMLGGYFSPFSSSPVF
jgi:hypothetical protein